MRGSQHPQAVPTERDLDEIRDAVEPAARAGAALLASGAAASEVAQAVLDVLAAAGLEPVTVDINYTALVITYHPPGATPYVHVTTIGGRTFNYGRQTDVLRVVERGRRVGRPPAVDPSGLAWAQHLRDVDGLPIAEIVAKTGIPRSSLYRHLPARTRHRRRYLLLRARVGHRPGGHRSADSQEPARGGTQAPSPT